MCILALKVCILCGYFIMTSKREALAIGNQTLSPEWTLTYQDIPGQDLVPAHYKTGSTIATISVAKAALQESENRVVMRDFRGELNKLFQYS